MDVTVALQLGKQTIVFYIATIIFQDKVETNVFVL